MAFNLGDIGAVGAGMREGTQDMMKLSDLISTQKSRALHDHLATQQSELANKKFTIEKDVHDVQLKREKFALEKSEMERKEGDRAHDVVNYIRMKSPGATPEQIKTMTDFGLSSGFMYKEGDNILMRERHLDPLMKAVKEDLGFQRTLEEQEHTRVSTQINDLLGQAAEMEKKDPMIAEKGNKQFNTLMENISALQGKQSKSVENIEEIKKRSTEKERLIGEIKMGPAIVAGQSRIRAAEIGKEKAESVIDTQTTSRETIAKETTELKKALQEKELELKRLQEEGKNKRAKEKAAAPSKTPQSLIESLSKQVAEQGEESLTTNQRAAWRLRTNADQKTVAGVEALLKNNPLFISSDAETQAGMMSTAYQLNKNLLKDVQGESKITPRERKWLDEARKRPANKNVPEARLLEFFRETYGQAEEQKSH
jgi:hypothetical protein